MINVIQGKKALLNLFGLLIFTSLIYSQTNGVIAYYPFDGNADDESGNNNNGVVYGATLVPDRFGNPNRAYYFDGIDNYIDIGSDPSLKPPLPVTFSAWINIDIPSPADTVTRGTIFASNFHATQYFGIRIMNNQFTDRLIITYCDGNTAGSESRRSKYIENTAYGEWFHLVGIIRGETDMDIYINGEDAGGIYSGSGGSLAYDGNPGRIGSMNASVQGVSQYLKGTLDDIVFFDRAIAEQEIDSLFNGNGQDPTLLAYYPFNGNADDESGNGNNGVVYGAILTEDRFNNPDAAYYFDGIDDYINLGADSSLKPDLPVSIATWMFLENPAQRDGIFCSNFHDTNYYGIHTITGISDQTINIAYGDGGSIGPDSRRAYKVPFPGYGVWFHYVGIIRGETDMSIFINGEELLGVCDGTGGSLAYDNGSANIGRHDVGAYNPPQYMQGKLDELYFFNYAINEAEVDSLYGNYSQTNGIVAHYLFNGNANDTSGNDNNGVVYGATLVPDRFGYPDRAYYFDGIDDFIDFGNDQTLKPNLPITVATWVKATEIGHSQGIFSNCYSDSFYYGIWAAINLNGRININYGDGGTFGPESRRSKSIPMLWYDEWFHLVFTIRSAYDMDIYINAVNMGGAYSGDGDNITYAYKPAYAGRNNSSTTTSPNYLNGSLDDLIIFNRELSQSEIETLYGGDVTIAGDANDDGVVNVFDLLTIVDHILGRSPAIFNFYNSDINTDSVINVLDIVLIVQIILGN